MCKCTPSIRTPYCGNEGCEWTPGEFREWKPGESLKVHPPKPDMVNHPSHYNKGKFEVIEIIEDQDLGFHLGSAMKYIARAGKKNPDKLVEDLEKAIWYLNRFIDIHDKRRA